MAGLSDIEWTDATWNPVSGCAIVSPGCTHCYAMRMAARLQAMGHPKYVGLTRKSGRRWVWTGRVRIDRGALDVPVHWRKPRRIFVNSMSDLFHEDVPEAFIHDVWNVMRTARWHTYQVLTKRPDRMAKVLAETAPEALPNVWVGTSVENSEYVYRIAELRRAPSAVRFVSFEPLIGPVGKLNLQGVHWAIVGGESGPGARPMDWAWVDEIRAACRRQGAAFFFKQWGGVRKKQTGRELDGRIWDEYPGAHRHAD